MYTYEVEFELFGKTDYVEVVAESISEAESRAPEEITKQIYVTGVRRT